MFKDEGMEKGSASQFSKGEIEQPWRPTPGVPEHKRVTTTGPLNSCSRLSQLHGFPGISEVGIWLRRNRVPKWLRAPISPPSDQRGTCSYFLNELGGLFTRAGITGQVSKLLLIVPKLEPYCQDTVRKHPEAITTPEETRSRHGL